MPLKRKDFGLSVFLATDKEIAVVKVGGENRRVRVDDELLMILFLSILEEAGHKFQPGGVYAVFRFLISDNGCG
jgi:hypothetical protein